MNGTDHYHLTLCRVACSYLLFLSITYKRIAFHLTEQTFFLVIQYDSVVYLQGKTMRHKIPSIMEVKQTEKRYKLVLHLFVKKKIMKIFEVCHIRCVKN